MILYFSKQFKLAKAGRPATYLPYIFTVSTASKPGRRGFRLCYWMTAILYNFCYSLLLYPSSRFLTGPLNAHPRVVSRMEPPLHLYIALARWQVPYLSAPENPPDHHTLLDLCLNRHLRSFGSSINNTTENYGSMQEPGMPCPPLVSPQLPVFRHLAWYRQTQTLLPVKLYLFWSSLKLWRLIRRIRN